jgi:hypothetical protein
VALGAVLTALVLALGAGSFVQKDWGEGFAMLAGYAAAGGLIAWELTLIYEDSLAGIPGAVGRKRIYHEVEKVKKVKEVEEKLKWSFSYLLNFFDLFFLISRVAVFSAVKFQSVLF